MLGKFFLRALIGLGVATVVTGGQALALAVGAVVCTAGVGLIVVLPVAYLIGLVCTIWFIPFGRQPSNEKKVSLFAPICDPAGMSSKAGLVLFMQRGISHGLSWEWLKEECLRKGWTNEDIQTAYESAREKGAANDGTPAPNIRTEMALRNYIGASLNLGRDFESIQAECRRAGWGDSIILEAYQAVAPDVPGNP